MLPVLTDVSAADLAAAYLDAVIAIVCGPITSGFHGVTSQCIQSIGSIWARERTRLLMREARSFSWTWGTLRALLIPLNTESPEDLFGTISEEWMNADLFGAIVSGWKALSAT